MVLLDLGHSLSVLLQNLFLSFAHSLLQKQLLVLEIVSFLLEIQLVLTNDRLVFSAQQHVHFVHFAQPRLLLSRQHSLLMLLLEVGFLSLGDFLDHVLDVLDLLQHFFSFLPEETDFVVQLLVFLLQ